MRKTVALVAILAALLGLSACGQSTTKQEQSGNTDTALTDRSETDNAVKDTGVKLEGTITAASDFSEGLAFVSVDGNKNVTYCINKQGNVVFTLNEKLAVTSSISAAFVNGLALLNSIGGICDTTGKITMPTDVGATAFYGSALSEGYILAESVLSDYVATQKRLGIMNTSFEWVVEPTAELYEALCGSLAGGWYCFDGVMYIKDIDRYLNLKTGAVTESVSATWPSSQWQMLYADKILRDPTGQAMLDLNDYKNLSRYSSIHFVDGKAAVGFYNSEARTYFVSLIDEAGKLLFDPVQTAIPAGNVENGGYRVSYDGQYILVTGGSANNVQAECYDASGNKLGSLSTESMKYMSYGFSLSDGVVLLSGTYNFQNTYQYYRPSFTALF